MSELYNVRKGDRRVQLADKKSMTDLGYTLMVLGCTEQISQSSIQGCREFGEIYEVTFLDRSVKAVGQNDAQEILRWMMDFGCQKVSIEKVGEVNKDD